MSIECIEGNVLVEDDTDDATDPRISFSQEEDLVMLDLPAARELRDALDDFLHRWPRAC